MYRSCCRFTASTTNAPAAEIVFRVFSFEKAPLESQDLYFDSHRLRNVNRWYMRDQTARPHKEVLVHNFSPWFLRHNEMSRFSRLGPGFIEKTSLKS